MHDINSTWISSICPNSRKKNYSNSRKKIKEENMILSPKTLCFHTTYCWWQIQLLKVLFSTSPRPVVLDCQWVGHKSFHDPTHTVGDIAVAESAKIPNLYNETIQSSQYELHIRKSISFAAHCWLLNSSEQQNWKQKMRYHYHLKRPVMGWHPSRVGRKDSY